MHTEITLFQFFYDISLSLILMAIGSIAFCLWMIRRKGIAIPIIGYFACCLVDTVIIFMTEAIPKFAVWYEQGFVYSPAVKTLVYVGSAFFTLSIYNVLTGKKFGFAQYFLLAILSAYLELVTLMPNSAFRVWLYFLAYQVFTISLCAYGLGKLKKSEKELVISKKLLKQLLWTTLVFSILIIIEDSVVIFFFDNYQFPSISIYNRNVSEDILRLYYVIFLMKFFVQYFSELGKSENFNTLENTDETVETSALEVTPMQEILPQLDTTDYKRIKFGRSIALSERELEVFLLVLEGHSNQEIGETLCISKGTVKAHIHNIFQKANVTQRRDLVLKFEEFEITP